MPLIDDLREPLTPKQLERRRLLAVIGSGAMATAAAGTGITAVRFMSPGVLYEASAKFKACPIDTLAPGTVLSFPKQKIYVVRDAGALYALSATCTHLGCMTRYEAEHARVFCPCHGSQFDLGGYVVGGPAPKPLPRLKVTIEKGLVVVDTKTITAPDEVVRV